VDPHHAGHRHHSAQPHAVDHHDDQEPSHPLTHGTTSSHVHSGHDAHVGHDKHAGHSVEMFRQKFWGTFLLSVPTIVWAPMIQHWLGYQAPGGPVGSRWIPAVFGTLVFAMGGGSSSRARRASSPTGGQA
jgi:Cu2+-exporting ATPase